MSCGSQTFLAYVAQVLALALQPRDIVIRNNLGVHKVAASVRRWGCRRDSDAAPGLQL
jgi:hypothetical protein